METGSRENYFEKYCYQEKARNRKVGKGKHKIENFFLMASVLTLRNVNETDYCYRRYRGQPKK